MKHPARSRTTKQTPRVLKARLSRALGGLLATMLALACRGGRPPEAPPDAPRAAPRALFALYVAGGNLEDSVLVRGSWGEDEKVLHTPGAPSPVGAASDDLRELVDGYRALSPEARQQVAIWVAFGGARKTGWHGLRYADGDCLLVDAANGRFGDADCYAFRDDKAEAAVTDGVAHFLRFIAAHVTRPALSMLGIWGQGGAWRGIIYDSLTQESPCVSLPEIKDALVAGGLHFDVVGLDAPYMSTLEVADTFRPFAKLLVAPPGLEPWHGWDYRAVVRALAAPDATALTLATALAENVMNGESVSLDRDEHPFTIAHRTSRGRSVSVIDLARVPEILASLDEVAEAGRTRLPALFGAFVGAPGHGRDRHVGTLESVDLAGATARLARAPGFEKAAADLQTAIGHAVIDFRRDERDPPWGPITVLPPFLRDRLRIYLEMNLLTPAWRRLLEASRQLADSDAAVPTAVRRGGRVEAADDTAILEVDDWYTQRGPNGAFRVLGGAPARLTHGAFGETSVQVARGPWDGQGWRLCNGPCGATGGLIVPAFLEAVLPAGHTLHAAPVWVRETRLPLEGNEGEDGILYFDATAAGEVTDAWIIPAEQDTNGNVLFSRDQYRLRPGLSLAFLTFEIEAPATKTKPLRARHRSDDVLVIDRPVGWRYGSLDQRAHLARRTAVYDLLGTVGFSDPAPLGQ